MLRDCPKQKEIVFLPLPLLSFFLLPPASRLTSTPRACIAHRLGLGHPLSSLPPLPPAVTSYSTITNVINNNIIIIIKPATSWKTPRRRRRLSNIGRWGSWSPGWWSGSPGTFQTKRKMARRREGEEEEEEELRSPSPGKRMMKSFQKWVCRIRSRTK